MLLREICDDVTVIAFSSPYAGAARGFAGQYIRRGTMSIVGVPEPGDYAIGADRPGLSIVPPRRGFALRDALECACCWNGTDTDTALEVANREGYDRVIVITDEQSHQTIRGPLPNTKAYFVNVATFNNGIGYGKWTHIDGFSEAIVSFIQEAESAGVPLIVDG